MSYTEGQWRVGDAGHTVYGPKKPDGTLPERIADVKRGDNARLIAAAPELLAACERALDYLDLDEDADHIRRLLDTAIAKATGK